MWDLCDGEVREGLDKGNERRVIDDTFLWGEGVEEVHVHLGINGVY